MLSGLYSLMGERGEKYRNKFELKSYELSSEKRSR